jgi:uncharacterized protein YdaU (DUF1376 family)
VQKTLGKSEESGENSSGRNGVTSTETALTTRAAKDSDNMADSESTTGRAPAFQFYPKDFLHDSNVVLMNLAERGAYITLLCYCWSEGSLSADHGRLARLCGVPAAAFKRLWPALEPCFRSNKDTPSRLIHPRLEREREKQADFKKRQSDNGKKGGRPHKPVESQNNPSLSSGLTQTEPKKSSASSSSTPSASSSADSSQKSGADVVDHRSKRPIFKGQRFVIFEWMLDDLSRMLGSHADEFDLHAWFYELDEKAVAASIVVPQRDGGKWLQEQTQAEAIRRGLPVATLSQHNPKTAGNVAAMARFVARGESN